MKKGKVAVITGASSGIGKALSIQLAIEYAIIFILGRNKENLVELKSQLESDKNTIHFIPLDLAKDDEIKSAVKLIQLKTTKVDLLINNAGLSQRAYAAETSTDIERKLFQVNYFGPILLTKLLIPQLRAAKLSKVLIVTSIAGKFGYALRSTYSAAKHALHGYFESMRFEEEKNGISILFSIPGRVKTDVSKNALTAAGFPHQKMDKGQEEGISAEQCAKEIIKQIQSNKREKLIGGKEILMVWFKKYIPWLFFSLAKNELKKDGAI